MLRPNVTEECYRLLELKFNVGQKQNSKFQANYTKLAETLELWYN